MRNVETQLGDYWAELVSDYPVPSAAELMESSAASRTGFDSTEWVASERRGDDLGVNHLLQFEEVPTRADRRRWHGLAVVASAAVLVAVGVVVAMRE
jgi:hypothetical protein